jgi:DNA-binding NtrC family response regulator
MEWFSEESEHELHELRCLHELARQLLPLHERDEVARDGLLCIAGITGIGSGAVFWSTDAAGLQPLSQFGVRQRIVAPGIDPSVQRFVLQQGATTFDACQRHAAGRALLTSLGGFPEEIRNAWVLPMVHETQLRGILLLGPSLVTGDLLPDSAWLTDLADTLRLALVGAEVRSGDRRATAAAEDAESRDWKTRSSITQRLQALRRRYPPTRDLVGESPAILAVLEEVITLAETDYTVMVHGGTGTGKEMAANLLHRLSRRNGGPFEAVDCSSIPQELIESELFGHVKGAFTGAMRDFKGAFERADGGTLLLDEIGDMDLRSQTRLLRVLQEGKVRPLGGDRPVSVDVRVVAATNRDLASMVRAGTFREDLYYRIHVCLLSIPPLRERGEDRIVLFEHFMRLHAQEIGRRARALSPQARQRLLREDFPGNVRQLQNVVRQLLVQSGEGEVALAELERVLQRATLVKSAGGAEPETDPATRSHVGKRGTIEDGARSGETAIVQDVGEWVLTQLRRHRFNLSAAAKSLAARRAGTDDRASVPVFDRGALDYYLCGEFYARLVRLHFDPQAAIRDLAGDEAAMPRLQRKVQAFLRPLQSHLDDGRSAEDVLARAFPRLPERYHGVLLEVVRAVRAGRWQPTAPTS